MEMFEAKRRRAPAGSALRAPYRRFAMAAALMASAGAVALAGLSACSALPDQAFAPPPVTVVKSGNGAAGQAATAEKTGKYPDFAEPLRAANVQMGNDEAARVSGRLSVLARARAEGKVSEAEYQRRLAELRRLAAEHGAAAETQIAK